MNVSAVSRELDGIVHRLVVESGAAPGATIALLLRDGSELRTAVGAAGRLTRAVDAPEVSTTTPYDLASVTKPFFATSVARLGRRGAIDLSAPLGALLVEARGTPSENVALELFLAHRAGLDAHRTLYRPLLHRRPFERAAALDEACRARRADCQGEAPPDGFAPLYSDLGFVLAGEAVARALGRPLDQLIADEVSTPLELDVGSARQWHSRDPMFSRVVAPSEHIVWRGGSVRGVVHDENAWALAGHGCAGQAGLFGTAASVARFGGALLDAYSGRPSDWLSHDDLQPLVRPRDGGSLRAGFDGKSSAGSASGQAAGPRTFGHLGFTGTSLWCDPDLELVSVLLSNRVCPTRDDVRLRGIRPLVQDALYAIAAAWRRERPA